MKNEEIFLVPSKLEMLSKHSALPALDSLLTVLINMGNMGGRISQRSSKKNYNVLDLEFF